MEALLGGWRSLLLPLASDPEIPRQAQQLCRALSAKGVTVSEDMLMVWCSALLLIRKTHAHKHQLLTVSLWVQVVLAASPGMTQEDLRQLAWGFSPDWDAECDSLLHAAVSEVTDQEEPRDHVVLILDKVRLNPLKGQVISVWIIVVCLFRKCQCFHFPLSCFICSTFRSYHGRACALWNLSQSAGCRPCTR